MKRLGFAAAVAVLCASPALAAPQCVEMRFLDAKGVLIPVSPPLIGIIIGDGPLFEGSPPPFEKAEAGRFVPCPQALIDSTQKVFDDSCTTEERRKKTAAQNNADISVINKRCGDLSATLAK